MTLPLFNTGPLIDAKPKELRPYQQTALQKLRTMVGEGKRRVMLVGPTGMGKMVLFANIIRTSTRQVLFVCHRMELIDQCARELEQLGITNIGVMRGDDERENPSASVQLASIQTLGRRKKPNAGIVLIDEAHRSASDSYLEHIFNFYDSALIFGATATPCRLDGRPLGDLYEEMLIVATYGELLKKPEWLVAPDCYSSSIEIDVSTIRITHGDYEESALAETMGKRELIGNLVEHWKKLAHMHPRHEMRRDARGAEKRVRVPGLDPGEPRRTFIFAVNIAHSKAICEAFAAAGVYIAHLDGDTPERERKSMLRAIGAGELQAISNCNVLLEGVDIPSVKCVVHARPTLSLVLWMQSTGRIMRPWRDVVPLLLDHAGNYDRHGPPHEDRGWHLASKPSRPTIPPRRLCKQCFAYVAPSRVVCPFCGYIFPEPPPVPKRMPSETDDALMLRDPEQAKREFYDRAVTKARMAGFKPGYPSVKFKEEYGAWPPWDWSDATKILFMTDIHWQDRVTRRQKSKEPEEPLPQEQPKTPWEAAGVTEDEWRAEMATGAVQQTKICSRCMYVEHDPEQVNCPMCGASDPFKPGQLRQEPADDGETFSDWLDEKGIR